MENDNLMEEESGILTLTDEDGREVDFEYLDSVDYDGKEFYANLYKCGDFTERPHYGSFAPMSTLPPGFHNPQLFAKIRFSFFI